MLLMNAATTALTLTAEPLWRRARESFARAVDSFGAPVVIAVLRRLTRPLRRAIVARLCLLEHVVRKLLLAEAAAIRSAELAAAVSGAPAIAAPPAAPPTRQTQAFAARRERAVMKPDLYHPQSWRAPFAYGVPADPPPQPLERKPRVLRNEDETAFRLARRLEALRRVLKDPLPHAARLANRLAREAQRVPELAWRFVLASARGNGCDHQDPLLGLRATNAAFTGCVATPAPFPDSS